MMIRKIFTALSIVWALFLVREAEAQQTRYKVGVIGFYNVENLFDTIDSPDTWDTEFTPHGSNLWDTKKYRKKLSDLAFVIEDLGKELNPEGISILGVSEVENRAVLEDLVKEPAIADRNYQIVHFDSPDGRGIDVGLLYNPKYFIPVRSRAIEVLIPEGNGDTTKTRDILYVAGSFDGEPMHIMVNHWPSRRGGEKASRFKRNFASHICKGIADSLRSEDPDAKIIIMGDLNDDPVSPSVAKILRSEEKPNKVSEDEFYNPFHSPFRRGIGTLAWRDSWNLFDQILVSQGLLGKPAEEYSFHKAVIYNPRYLVQKTGQYKGYPYRTLAGGNYLGGYSDHFPVFIYIIKAVNQ